MADTIRIGGIKLSGELVQIDCRFPRSSTGKLTELLCLISAVKINIPHLHQGRVGDNIQTTLCLEDQDYNDLQQRLQEVLESQWFRVVPSVGTLTVYPHGASIGFVARVYSVFAEEGFPVYGISTSVSALVIHTDYALLDRGVVALLSFCELPQNHTPFRPDFRMQQIER